MLERFLQQAAVPLAAAVSRFETLRSTSPASCFVSIPAYNVALNLVVIRVHGRHPTSVRRLLKQVSPTQRMAAIRFNHITNAPSLSVFVTRSAR
jgi:hypothetical protein